MQIIDDRRALHRIPELDNDLPETMAYLSGSLSGLGCTLLYPIKGCVCAFFDFGRDSAIAFRADADALPIAENTGLDFASCHPGRMHACGHDGHMAIVLELARRLSRTKALPHNVLLVFQPSEETTGGAKALCDTGIFSQYRVEAIFGLHLWPGLTAGVIASRKNAMMSRSCEVTVKITGRSAHIANASQGLDALAAGVEFYRLARAGEQALPEKDFRILNFGRMESGTVRNAVSGQTVLYGTLRAFRDDVFFRLQQMLRSAGEQVQSETGCQVTVEMNEGYPAVWNPSSLYQKAKAAADFQELPSPSLITEDFSWYQRTLPGLFFFLGTGDTPALHADNFQFDEAILTKGADFFQKLAENFQ